MTEFKIRAYGRMELAQLYSPKNEEMDLFMSRTSATSVRLGVRIKASLIHTVGGESDCGRFGRTLKKLRIES